MKPGFALDLSVDGITLLHRAAGGWDHVGDVALDDPDLPDALAALRDRALALEPEAMTCKVIIPNDQIKFLALDRPASEQASDDEAARAALETTTPYALSDLAYDVAAEGTQIFVAAVARETLAEAEGFAEQYGFNPVSFVATPEATSFPREPFFGPAENASTLSLDDEIEPDTEIVVKTGKAAQPLQADPDANAPSEPTPDPHPPEPEPVTTFSSRRTARPAPTDAPDAPQEGPEARLAGVAAPDLAIPALPTDAPEPEPAATPAAPVAPPRPDPVTERAATVTDADQDEAARLTVFGARSKAPAPVGGKPRHLGLILTLLLLFALVLVALWASLFLEGGVSALFKGRPDPTELAAEPEPISDPLPAVEPSLAEPEALTVAPSRPEPPQAELTDTDTAVLDALRREDPEPVPNAPAPPPQTIEPPQTLTDGPAPDPQATTSDALSAQTLYDATGIWPTAPQAPATPDTGPLADILVPVVPRPDAGQDAVELPPLSDLAEDFALAAPASPAAIGTAFDLDDRGLVTPSAAGTLTPDGILVYAGPPPVVPPPTPTRFETQPETDALADAVADRLAGLRPQPRPENLAEQFERAQLGGRTFAELGNVRPRVRPRSLKEEAESDATPTAQAVVVSRVPRIRPSGFATIVARAKPATPAAPAASPQVATVAPRAVTPRIPSSASVARQATLENAINLRRVNLIGVYGTPSNRRALVRLPSGRYKKVKIGDTVDGGRIIAIGDSELRYQKGGRNLTLKMPRS